jgi:hypothetical protein
MIDPSKQSYWTRRANKGELRLPPGMGTWWRCARHLQLANNEDEVLLVLSWRYRTDL